MIGRRRLVILLGGGAFLPAAPVSAKRARRRVRAAAATPWVVRLGGQGDLLYLIDFRRGEMGAPTGAFDHQRGIRLVGPVRGTLTLTGVGVPHVVADEQADVALQCAGILTVAGGPTRWACDLTVSLGGG